MSVLTKMEVQMCVCAAPYLNLLKFSRQDVLLITFVSKRPAALNAAETLWVPVLIQSCHHFLQEERETSGLGWTETLLRLFIPNQLRDTNDGSFSRSEWACCSGHSGGRRG